MADIYSTLPSSTRPRLDLSRRDIPDSRNTTTHRINRFRRAAHHTRSYRHYAPEGCNRQGADLQLEPVPSHRRAASLPPSFDRCETKAMAGRTEDSLAASTSSNQGANELVKAVDKLLNDLGPKFAKVSAELFAKMDDMAQRLDDMESAIKAGNESGSEGN
ncbi:hypothetical protein N7G274_000015 [Stereocaulon virgatum]|uniref:Heat shock factor binding protein 1 n=1 Tax=Stereocaulon virgatum TaxID=373712 RepID=A0ABR4AQW4_9LECA